MLLVIVLVAFSFAANIMAVEFIVEGKKICKCVSFVLQLGLSASSMQSVLLQVTQLFFLPFCANLHAGTVSR